MFVFLLLFFFCCFFCCCFLFCFYFVLFLFCFCFLFVCLFVCLFAFLFVCFLFVLAVLMCFNPLNPVDRYRYLEPSHLDRHTVCNSILIFDRDTRFEQWLRPDSKVEESTLETQG